MQRRSFIKGCSAAILSASVPTLISAPHSLQMDVLRTPEAGCQGEWDPDRPVVIGLGAAGSIAVNRINQATYLPKTLSCYTLRQNLAGIARAEASCVSTLPFDQNVSGVLVFSPDDPWAIHQAMALAEQMRQAEVYITAAVLLADPAEHCPRLDLLRTKLDGLIYAPKCWSNTLDINYQPLTQTLRSFFAEPGWIGVDCADIKAILARSRYGIARTTGYTVLLQGGKPGEVVRQQIQSATPGNATGVIAMLQDGGTITIEDLDDIIAAMREKLDVDQTQVITNINPDFPDGDLQLLTLVMV